MDHKLINQALTKPLMSPRNKAHDRKSEAE